MLKGVVLCEIPVLYSGWCLTLRNACRCQASDSQPWARMARHRTSLEGTRQTMQIPGRQPPAVCVQYSSAILLKHHPTQTISLHLPHSYVPLVFTTVPPSCQASTIGASLCWASTIGASTCVRPLQLSLQLTSRCPLHPACTPAAEVWSYGCLPSTAAASAERGPPVLSPLQPWQPEPGALSALKQNNCIDFHFTAQLPKQTTATATAQLPIHPVATAAPLQLAEEEDSVQQHSS